MHDPSKHIFRMPNGEKRNSTNCGRAKVEKLTECINTPTLVYYADGSIAVQHPIVYNLINPLTDKEQLNISDDDSFSLFRMRDGETESLVDGPTDKLNGQ